MIILLQIGCFVAKFVHTLEYLNEFNCLERRLIIEFPYLENKANFIDSSEKYGYEIFKI